MNNFLIQKYINKLTKQDIINYITNQNIKLPDKEIDIIYNYIKTNGTEFLKGNTEKLLKDIKTKVSPKTYQLIENYYYTYKNKI